VKLHSRRHLQTQGADQARACSAATQGSEVERMSNYRFVRIIFPQNTPVVNENLFLATGELAGQAWARCAAIWCYRHPLLGAPHIVRCSHRTFRQSGPCLQNSLALSHVLPCDIRIDSPSSVSVTLCSPFAIVWLLRDCHWQYIRWMRYVTRVDVFCHIYEWIMLHV